MLTYARCKQMRDENFQNLIGKKCSQDSLCWSICIIYHSIIHKNEDSWAPPDIHYWEIISVIQAHVYGNNISTSHVNAPNMWQCAQKHHINCLIVPMHNKYITSTRSLSEIIPSALGQENFDMGAQHTREFVVYHSELMKIIYRCADLFSLLEFKPCIKLWFESRTW